MTQQIHQSVEELTANVVPVSRREMLKLTGATAGVLAFGTGVGAFSRRAAASSHVTETIYLSHSVDSEGVTKLYSVDLDSTPGEAVLTLVTSIGSPFQNVDAIAATPDGQSVVFVDRNTAHLGEYDVDSGTFTDHGQITGLPTITVLAAFGLDGILYAASNSTNKLYSIDDSVSPPEANEIGTITGATVNGADIVVDSTGTMFLHTNSNDTLYTIDYQNPDANGDIAATGVGTDAGSSLTGLAVRDAGQGDLVGSSRADDAIVVLDKTNGSRTATYNMTLNGSAYSYTNGDMATGTLVDETCTDCTGEERLAKYEFECVETVDDECVAWDFVQEGSGTEAISYSAGSYENKDGEMHEPITATFETDYCELWAVVKAGPETDTQALTAEDGTVTITAITGENRGGKTKTYAISNVEFYCPEDSA